MGNNTEGLSLLLIIVTILVSYQGFKSSPFFNKYAFEVDGVLVRKEYVRLISSGFLHANWLHLIFNMASLYAFSAGVEKILGIRNFVILYFCSLVFGSLLSLYIHRNHGDYRSIGASGAVSGVIFASILFFPDLEISLLLMDVGIPGWLFGILYLMITMYGVKSQTGTIGHDAHLGGAIGGMVTACVIRPDIIQAHPLLLAALLLPTIGFLIMIAYRPYILYTDSNSGYAKINHEAYELSRQYQNSEDRLNYLLEKVNEKGLESLSKREKHQLEELSKSMEN